MSKRQIVILIAGALIVAAVWVAAALVMNNRKSPGGFTPPPFEEAAEEGMPELDDSRFQVFDFAGVFSAGLLPDPELKDGKADIYLSSPSTNTVWMKCKLLDEDGKLLGETGVIRPGTYVKSVIITRQPGQDVPITYRVISYEPETYYSEGSVNIATTLHVAE